MPSDIAFVTMVMSYKTWNEQLGKISQGYESYCLEEGHINHDTTCINPFFIGRLFHCYMLDESICHLGVSGPFCNFYSISDEKSC